MIAQQSQFWTIDEELESDDATVGKRKGRYSPFQKNWDKKPLDDDDEDMDYSDEIEVGDGGLAEREKGTRDSKAKEEEEISSSSLKKKDKNSAPVDNSKEVSEPAIEQKRNQRNQKIKAKKGRNSTR